MIDEKTEISKEELHKLLKKKFDNLEELEKFGKNSTYIAELSDIALIQLQLGEYFDSEKNYIVCLRHFEKQKDRLGQAAVYGVLGTLYFKKNEYIKSIEYCEKSYNIYKDLNQTQEQITCLKLIGNNLLKLYKLDEACDIFLECGALCSDNSDIYNLLDCLGNLIYIHETQEKWDVVFELYKKTLKAFKELSDTKGIVSSYFNLGILQKKNNNIEEALRYFKKGTNVAIDANYAELIIKGLGYAGESFFNLGEIKEATDQFIRALYIADKIKAQNAKAQIRILLISMGLHDKDIQAKLKIYKESRK
ncbi:MAG: tetratricopeptide repeat protein [Promethearchaeota archaeon]|jgi:tetratricopeptide (TPR) repeat protein